MKVTIQVLIESPGVLPLNVPIQTVDRPCDRVEDVGLRLEEAKAVLKGLQEQLIRQQLAEYLEARRRCPDCRQLRAIKGYHQLRFRSAFGDLALRSPRWCRCECAEPSGPATFSALHSILTTHTAPELEMLQAKWAAHLSFAVVADLLHDVLPVDSCANSETIRAHVFETAERLEAELGPEQFAYDAGCQNEIEASPDPGAPVTVGLDGGYIRGRERRDGGTGCFEVIAGKSIPQEGPAKLFAGVGRIDKKPKRRLHEVLQSQGVLPRQQVIFISDCGDTVRELPAFLHPHSEHILDWFHIAMRIEQLLQTAQGFRGTAGGAMTREGILKELERAKWFLWHGNVFRADETLTDLMFEVDGAIVDFSIPCPIRQQLMSNFPCAVRFTLFPKRGSIGSADILMANSPGVGPTIDDSPERISGGKRLADLEGYSLRNGPMTPYDTSSKERGQSRARLRVPSGSRCPADFASFGLHDSRTPTSGDLVRSDHILPAPRWR
jgi:hypothetical protein